jgi:hypothetical protein
MVLTLKPIPGTIEGRIARSCALTCRAARNDQIEAVNARRRKPANAGSQPR